MLNKVNNIIKLMEEDENKQNLRKDFLVKESELRPIPVGMFDDKSSVYSESDKLWMKIHLKAVSDNIFKEDKKMKLADLIKKLRVINPKLEVLTPEMLRAIKDDLQLCDEFKNSELEIVDEPTSSFYKLKAYKVRDEAKFDGKTYLYNIMLTPVMYLPTCNDRPVKNNCSISPVLYDDKNFTPFRKIQLFINNEIRQDFFGRDEDYKSILHEVLEDALNNPKDYEVKGFRSLIVRCDPYRYNCDVIENGEKVIGCNNNDNQIIPE